MRNKKIRGKLIALAALMLIVPAASGREKIDETMKLNMDGKVRVSNISGSVTISGWDKKEVRITGTLGENVKELVVEGNSKRLEIEVKYPKRAKDVGRTELCPRSARSGLTWSAPTWR